MQASDLVTYIKQNNLVVPLLEKIGCKQISSKSFQKDIRCALPDGDNPTSVSINKDTLFVSVYSRGINGSIFDFVSYVYDCTFYVALKKIHTLLGIPFEQGSRAKSPTEDVLAVYKRAKGRTYSNLKNDEFEGYELDYLNNFIRLPHKSWIDSGCTFDACKRFNLCFDSKANAVIIPWFKWAIPLRKFSKPIAGFVRRTTLPNAKELGIPKYKCDYKFDKGNHLFGLAQNYYDIKRLGYVVVFEAERSVVQRASYGDYSAVAIGSHEITQKQREMLVALGVDIIIAFDKDVPEDFLKLTCSRFRGVRNLSYLLDTNNLLGETESPADKLNTIYQQLFRERKQYVK